MVPRGAAVLPNANGTAPGLCIESGDQVLVLLPGPPRELIPMLDGPVRERLEPRSAGTRLYARVVRVFGRSESHTEEAAAPALCRVGAGATADRSDDPGGPRRDRPAHYSERPY